jgi:hypothetical protein
LNHFTNPDFWARYHKLPDNIRRRADAAYALLRENPRHPSLHFKKVGDFWSARVTLDIALWQLKRKTATFGSGSDGMMSTRKLSVNKRLGPIARCGAAADAGGTATGGRASHDGRHAGTPTMPSISAFYGLIVYMYFKDNKQHKLPHIHVRYSGEEVIVSIPDGDVLEGGIPSSKMKLLQAWIEIHKEELMADWELAVAGEQPYKIDPLK